MKYKSILDNSIDFEVWQTPVMKSNELWLMNQLYTEFSIYFFSKEIMILHQRNTMF